MPKTIHHMRSAGPDEGLLARAAVKVAVLSAAHGGNVGAYFSGKSAATAEIFERTFGPGFLDGMAVARVARVGFITWHMVTPGIPNPGFIAGPAIVAFGGLTVLQDALGDGRVTEVVFLAQTESDWAAVAALPSAVAF